MASVWIVATAALLGPAPNAGQPPEDAALPARKTSSLEITLVPGVWLPRINGDSTLGAGAPSIDVRTQLGHTDTAVTPNIELAVRMEEVWELIIGGFAFWTESRTQFVGNATWGSLTLSNGDPIRATFDISSVSAELAVALWRPYADRDDTPNLDNMTWEGRYIADLRFSPMIGARWIGIDQSITPLGGSPERGGGDWVAIYAGFDITLDYRPQAPLPFLKLLRLEASAAVGPAIGGAGGWMFQVHAGVSFHFIENLGLLVGYRLIELDLKKSDYQFRGGLQGLFLAGSIRF